MTFKDFMILSNGNLYKDSSNVQQTLNEHLGSAQKEIYSQDICISQHKYSSA